MKNQPLIEVFGFPPDNFSDKAIRYRDQRLCPYNNHVANCTKDKANNPLGVCTIRDNDRPAITCPVRFREDWIIASDAARFFFPEGTAWTSMAEVQLNDRFGQSAGKIDLVLVSYDKVTGRLIDFGSMEVQGVYITGNVRKPFEYYLENPVERQAMTWSGQLRADYLSSSRKRLAPQLIFKGGILSTWGKKMAVALHSGFFSTLPALPEVEPDQADMAWLIYDLVHEATQNQYHLTPARTVYTKFRPSLETITTPIPGSVDDFVGVLQERLDSWLEDRNPPDAPPLDLSEVMGN